MSLKRSNYDLDAAPEGIRMNKREQLVELAKNNTIVFIGATAAGKDTVMRSICELTGSPILLSHTTRPMRPGELDGVEYYFTNDQEFEAIKMVEERVYSTKGSDYKWKYGLSEKVAATQGLLILDWEGFKDFKEWRISKGYEAPVSVFVTVDKEESRRRQKRRGDYYEPEFERRWESDMKWASDAAEGSDWVWDEEWLENTDSLS